MNYPISKQAGIEDAFKHYVSTVWKSDAGPFENLFRLLPYAAVPFLGGLGSIISLVLIQLAKLFMGLDLEELGREADSALGLGPGSDPREDSSEEELSNYIDRRVELAKAASHIYYDDRDILKTAGIKSAWSIGKIIAGGIFKLLAVLSSLYVFSHLGELYDKHLKKDVEKATKPAREKVRETVGLEPEQSTPTAEPTNINTMIDELEQKYGLS
jgi:hypothetical protein